MCSPARLCSACYFRLCSLTEGQTHKTECNGQSEHLFLGAVQLLSQFGVWENTLAGRESETREGMLNCGYSMGKD